MRTFTSFRSTWKNISNQVKEHFFSQHAEEAQGALRKESTDAVALAHPLKGAEMNRDEKKEYIQKLHKKGEIEVSEHFDQPEFVLN